MDRAHESIWAAVKACFPRGRVTYADPWLMTVVGEERDQAVIIRFEPAAWAEMNKADGQTFAKFASNVTEAVRLCMADFHNIAGATGFEIFIDARTLHRHPVRAP